MSRSTLTTSSLINHKLLQHPFELDVSTACVSAFCRDLGVSGTGGTSFLQLSPSSLSRRLVSKLSAESLRSQRPGSDSARAFAARVLRAATAAGQYLQYNRSSNVLSRLPNACKRSSNELLRVRHLP
eukprot:3962279-Amphidinium_carterae.1